MPWFLVIENVEKELAWLEPHERWSLFLQPLRDALAEEQLGEILNIDELIREEGGRRTLVGDEIAIEVSDLDRARDVLRRIEHQARDRKSDPDRTDEGRGAV